MQPYVRFRYLETGMPEYMIFFVMSKRNFST